MRASVGAKYKPFTRFRRPIDVMLTHHNLNDCISSSLLVLLLSGRYNVIMLLNTYDFGVRQLHLGDPSRRLIRCLHNNRICGNIRTGRNIFRPASWGLISYDLT